MYWLSYSDRSHTHIPCRVSDAISEPCQHIDNHQNRIWRMRDRHHIRSQVTRGAKNCNATLAKLRVYPVVEDRGKCIADEWAEENERDECVGKVVVWAQVGNDGTIRRVVHPQYHEGPEGGQDARGVAARMVPAFQRLGDCGRRRKRRDYILGLVALRGVPAAARSAVAEGEGWIRWMRRPSLVAWCSVRGGQRLLETVDRSLNELSCRA